MEIEAPRLARREGMVSAEADFVSADGAGTLWFAVAPEHAHGLVTERADAFLVALLLRAMRRGEDVTVRAPLSARLHHALANGYQHVLAAVTPGVRPVRIAAAGLEEAPLPTAGGVATGFSAGVDSFAVVRDHLFRDVPPGHRLTHFTFHNVGSHGTRDPARARALFRARHAAIRGFPDGVGLPFVAVDSNLGEVLPFDFEQTHTTRNLAAALALQKLFRRFYYASTFHYRDVAVRRHHDSAIADPVAVPMLSTETLDAVPAGAQYTRVEKTRALADVPGAERWLNVCATESPDGRNCSACPKCSRTLFTLELLGMAGAFAGVFDLARWERERNRYIVTRILRGGPVLPLTREVIALAREVGYPFTLRQRATALALRPVPRPVYRLGRSLRRRWAS